MHGQSDYTPLKQKHVINILESCREGLKPKNWTHKDVLFVDCTAGGGYSQDGSEGSPLLINGFARKNYNESFRHLCCENDYLTFLTLKRHESKLKNATLEYGDYCDIVPSWLSQQNVRDPAMGIVYCDANGAKDLLRGMNVFRAISADRRFCRMDFLFHWSMTAYNRNHGAGYTWARKELIEVTDELVSLKKFAFMRQPVDRWQWAIMHLINTDKVSSESKKERILPYSVWRDGQTVKPQLDLFEMETA